MAKKAAMCVQLVITSIQLTSIVLIAMEILKRLFVKNALVLVFAKHATGVTDLEWMALQNKVSVCNVILLIALRVTSNQVIVNYANKVSI